MGTLKQRYQDSQWGGAGMLDHAKASARLVAAISASEAQEALAYRVNFAAAAFEALLRLMTGVAGLAVLFSHVERVRGWDFPATVALLGAYLVIDGLRELVINPSFTALAGEGGDVRSGQFDYTLLRPVNVQFLSSIKRWRVFSLLDLVMGVGVVLVSMLRLGHTLTPAHIAAFGVALVAAIAVLYALTLACAALVFWAPEVYFTWVFDGVFQLGRYPVDLYPAWLRVVLTWVIPIGVMTTIPAQALTGATSIGTLAGALALAGVLVVGASALFRIGLRRYTSASS